MAPPNPATISDWTGLITLFFTLVTLGGGAVFLRSEIKRLIMKVDELDGEAATQAASKAAQDVVNRSVEKMIDQIQATRDLALATSAKGDAHDKECIRLREGINARFDKVDRGMESINRQIGNLMTRRPIPQEFSVRDD